MALTLHNMSDKLAHIMQELSYDISTNNKMIKEKIKRKISIIMHMKQNAFSIMNYDISTAENILGKLKNYYETKSFLIYNDELNKLLGGIIHNIYQYSGFQILLNNVPEYGILKYENILEKIDSQVIYDTLAEFVDMKEIISVFKVSTNSYIAKLADNDKAKQLCALLNDKLICSNIIKVEYIFNLSNNLISSKIHNYDINSIDDIAPNNNSDVNLICIQNKSQNPQTYFSYIQLFITYLYNNIVNGVNFIINPFLNSNNYKSSSSTSS